MATDTSQHALLRSIVDHHARPDDLQGYLLVATTLLPLAALWALVAAASGITAWLVVPLVPVMALFLLRAFVLMHECGHGSLFRQPRLNRVFGFVFGIICGMPQFVWSAHHRFHHATNGNWTRYQGPLSVIAVAEFAALDMPQQRHYQHARSVWRNPHAGFFYLIFTPRWILLKGAVALLRHRLRGASTQTFTTPHWNSATEFHHMLWTTIALAALWALMAWLVGCALFLAVHLAAASIAGWAGIVIFTVQHNFEHSYASGDSDWSRRDAAIRGTSYLRLPRWLNWFTASIGYHHVHHLSARIPSYRLAACHIEHAALFTGVRRITLAGIPAALEYILWDTAARRLISVAEYRRQCAVATATGV